MLMAGMGEAWKEGKNGNNVSVMNVLGYTLERVIVDKITFYFLDYSC